MGSLFGNLFSSKPHKSKKRQSKMQLKYHKLKLEHKKSKSKKCCIRCAGLNISKSINCRMGVYPTCKKSGCINKNKTVKNQKGGDVFDLSYIKKIEGPIYVSILEPTPLLNNEVKYIAPKLLLLGDLHIGSDKCKEGCEKEKGCYSLYEDGKFSLLHDLDEKAKLQNLKIDLYVESWFNDFNEGNYFPKQKNFNYKNSKNENEQNSALSNVIELSYFCHNKKINNKKCPFTNMRIHMSDPRKNYEDLLSMLETINKIEDDKYMTKQIVFYKFVIKKYPYLGSIDSITPEYLFDLIKRIIKGYTINDFIQEPYFIHTNKSLKQYYKLLKQSPNIAKKIIENAQTIYTRKHYFKFLYDGTKKLLDMTNNDVAKIDFNDVENKINNNNRTKKIKDTFKKLYEDLKFKTDEHIFAPLFIYENDFNNFIVEFYKIDIKYRKQLMDHIDMFSVDLHTVCRLLKVPEKKGDINNTISSLSIIYLGYEHIKNINKLLKNIYDLKYEKISSENINNDFSNYSHSIQSGDEVNDNFKCIDVNIYPSQNNNIKTNTKKSICNVIKSISIK